MVSRNRSQPWTAEQIVDKTVPSVLEEHVEITKVSSRNRGQQRFEEQSVSQKRISECRVEQVVDVPAGQMEQVSQYSGDTVKAVEFRKKFFGVNTDRDSLFHELKSFFLLQFSQGHSCCCWVSFRDEGCFPFV